MTLYYIGECYENLSQTEGALDYYNQAIKIDPLLSDAWAGIGMLYEERGELEIAIRHIDKALNIEPSNPDFWYMMGDTLYKAGRYDEALKSYINVANLDPKHPEIWLDYSHIYALDVDYFKAIEIIDEGIAEQPENADFLYRKFVYLHRMMLHKEAYDILEEALIKDYKKHSAIFDYDPDLFKDTNLLRIIEIYKIK
jgi:tetratricopeptide (TPR) repeat protein